MTDIAERESDFIGVPEAIKLAAEFGIHVTPPTAISWIRKHRLGHQPGGRIAKPQGDKWSRWLVSRQRWMDFILGRL